jgi:sugar phosphate isomerase/epimerase
MLLTLTASCLKGMLLPTGRSKKPKMEIMDLPAFTRDSLGLSGFNLSTDLLVGADRAKLEAIRERTDRASCSCLLLIEPEPQHFGARDEKKVAAAVQRMTNVIDAAHLLGCSAASMKIEAPDDDETLVRVAKALKPIMDRAERNDINLALSPHAGLTHRPERVTELLKKVGGFRIGTYPDFQTAHLYGQGTPEGAVGYLHRLTPYASAVCVSTTGFGVPGKAKGKAKATEPAITAPETMLEPRAAVHVEYDLRPMLDAVRSVGYDGPLALDYRGPGDVPAGLRLARSIALTALGAEDPDAIDDELDDIMAELEAEDAAGLEDDEKP